MNLVEQLRNLELDRNAADDKVNELQQEIHNKQLELSRVQETSEIERINSEIDALTEEAQPHIAVADGSALSTATYLANLLEKIENAAPVPEPEPEPVPESL